MYVELAQIKKHLNIDTEFTDDDDYLLVLADVAEKAVEKHINQRLSSVCEENGGVLPSPLLHANKKTVVLLNVTGCTQAAIATTLSLSFII